MRLRCSTTALSVLLACSTVPIAHNASAAEGLLGGLLENPLIKSARTVLSRTQIESFLPSKGRFTFPAPYNTQAIRLTNADDCNGGDCVDYIGYAYWNNINNHRGQDTMLIFVGMDRRKGGQGPTLLQYNKLTDKVDNLGPVFDSSSSFSWHSGEGFYFSDTMPTTLYVYSDTRLFRYDVLSKKMTTVFDAKTHFGNGHYIWQLHSSADDRVHSATLRSSSNYQMEGCMVYREDTGKFLYYPRKGAFDECQIDKSGKWLLIKEDVDGKDGEDNRIINIETGQERILLDRDGAAGHSDMGYGYMIAADNFAPQANTQKLWRFDENPLRGVKVYANSDWTISAPAHVSHSNASPTLPPEKQYACGSSVNRSRAGEANEIVCFKLDGSGQSVVVAPVMTDLNAVGGGDDYAKYPKGNLDVTGQYFIWTSNMGGNRLDAFLVKIPTHLLGGTQTETPAPTPRPTPPPVVEPQPQPQPTPPPSNGGAVDAPTQTDIKVSDITSNSARITWRTNRRAEDLVRFGTTTNYDRDSGINSTLTTNHSVLLRDLRPGTRYNFRVYARDAAGNIATSENFTFTTLTDKSTTPSTPSTSGSLTWSQLRNVQVSGNSLVKSSNCDGCADTRAVSQQTLTDGNGFVEFTVSNTQGLGFLGVGTTSANSATALDYALRIQSGYVEVREKGAYRADTAIKSGDVLRISVQNGKVQYSRNGKVFYTSNRAPTYPLQVQAYLYSKNSGISNAKVGKN